MKEMIIDAFAGGGGASVGIEMALGRQVDVAVNHDPDAILMHYLMRMEDGWCCGVEGEHIVEGKNQQDIIKSMSNIKVCHCSKCRHWLSRWVDLSWKIGKAD